MYKQGMGYIRIAKALNEKQILPPGVYKRIARVKLSKSEC